MMGKKYNSTVQAWRCVVLVGLVLCGLLPMGILADDETSRAITWIDNVANGPAMREKFVSGLLLRNRDSFSIRGYWNHELWGSYFDEIDRRFGKDNNPNIRAMVVEGLVRKGIKLRDRRKYSNDPAKPGEFFDRKAAIAVFDDIERRFGGDEYFAVRAQVVRALVEKGLAEAERNNPTAAIAVFDDVVLRFEKDKAALVRAQVVRALIKKAEVLELELISNDPEMKNLKKRIAQKFGRGEPDMDGHHIVRSPCWARLVTDEKTKSHITIPDSHPDNAEAAEKTVVEPSRRCQRPDMQEVFVIYDEINRRFGKDNAPEVRQMLAESLFAKIEVIHNMYGYEQYMQFALPIYDEINRRFGSKRADYKTQVTPLCGEIPARFDWFDRFELQGFFNCRDHIDGRLEYEIQSFYKEIWGSQIERQFGEKIGELNNTGHLLQQQGHFDAAVAIYDYIEWRFGIFGPQFAAMSLFRKGEILERQGEIDLAADVYLEIVHRYSKKEHGALNSVIEFFYGKTVARHVQDYVARAAQSLARIEASRR
jgi:tetratricopeptide (TPR) repeat protein